MKLHRARDEKEIPIRKECRLKLSTTTTTSSSNSSSREKSINFYDETCP